MSTERETVEKVNIFQKTESIDLNWTIGIGCHDRSLTSSKSLDAGCTFFPRIMEDVQTGLSDSATFLAVA